jgi:hypothetical protein
MKKITYIVLLQLVSFTAINAQMQATFTNFLMNEYYYNPAIAGSKNVHTSNMSYPKSMDWI